MVTGLLKTRVAWCRRCCGVVRRAIDMLGKGERRQAERFVAGSLGDLVPDDQVLVRVDRVLDLAWLPEEVADDGARGSTPRSRRA